MRKLLLVLFLFSLTSNALAKVEGWKCTYDEGKHPPSLYKINLEVPVVHVRMEGEWVDMEEFLDITPKYSKEHHTLFFYLEDGHKSQAIDFITKELLGWERDKLSFVQGHCIQIALPK